MIKKSLAVALSVVFIAALLLAAAQDEPAKRPAWMDQARPADGMANYRPPPAEAAAQGQELVVKWIQQPDLTPVGMDVSAFYHSFYDPFVLADDFLCTSPGPLLEIHIWGSWFGDYLPYQGDPEAVEFVLSIHADVPAGPTYSYPGELLWLGMPRFEVIDAIPGLWEGWLEPPSYYTPGADTTCWEYVFYLDSTDFIQEGTVDSPIVYWLNVQAYSYDEYAFFGWKTSYQHWNDAAVWAYGADGGGALYWEPLIYPPGYNVDLAFSILGAEPEEIRDTVVCEPQGGGNPTHPSTYWYDVTPVDFGRCDFHVLVGDSNVSNYSNVSLPYDSWTWALHKVGGDWWFSWFDLACDSAIFTTTRFQFDNSNLAMWGHWTTTISATADPFDDAIDSSWNHVGEADGYGYRVHVPAPGPAVEWDHKMHYPQLPDEAGWDVMATWPYMVLADDFMCTENGFIKDLHFWGSWLEEMEGELFGFLVEIYSDRPDPDGPGPGYSMPESLLWVYEVYDFKWEQFVSPTPEGFYWPGEGYATSDHYEYFRYDVVFDSAWWFRQDSGTIYWVCITAGVSDYDHYWWGWKTSENHWNDDAVWAFAGGPPHEGTDADVPPREWRRASELPYEWMELLEPPTYTHSLDLAFVITGDCCKGISGNADYDPADICDISDLTEIIDYLFITFEPCACMAEANADGSLDLIVDISDLTRVISYLFIEPYLQPEPCL